MIRAHLRAGHDRQAMRGMEPDQQIKVHLRKDRQEPPIPRPSQPGGTPEQRRRRLGNGTGGPGLFNARVMIETSQSLVLGLADAA
jgi:hypothetical protein